MTAFDPFRPLALRMTFPPGRNVSAADKPLLVPVTPEHQLVSTSSRKLLSIDVARFGDGLTISRFDRHPHEIVAFYPPARDAFSIRHVAIAPIKLGFWTISAPEGRCRTDPGPLPNHPTRMRFGGGICASREQSCGGNERGHHAGHGRPNTAHTFASFLMSAFHPLLPLVRA